MHYRINVPKHCFRRKSRERKRSRDRKQRRLHTSSKHYNNWQSDYHGNRKKRSRSKEWKQRDNRKEIPKQSTPPIRGEMR